MTLNQPYYIDKRTGSAHIDLDGEWQFCYTDVARDDVENLDFEYTTTIPPSRLRAAHLPQRGRRGGFAAKCAALQIPICRAH